MISFFCELIAALLILAISVACFVVAMAVELTKCVWIVCRGTARSAAIEARILGRSVLAFLIHSLARFIDDVTAILRFFLGRQRR